MTESSRETASLTVVGTGISFLNQLTAEARSHIEDADRVIYAVVDPAMREWILQHAQVAEPFHSYLEDRPRVDTFDVWVEQMLAPLDLGERVCAVFYGHPAVGVPAACRAVSRARKEGYAATVLPGISATDCLWSDLGVNPLVRGVFQMNADAFLQADRDVPASSHTVLWQIDLLGEETVGDPDFTPDVSRLATRLLPIFGADHGVVLYRASSYAHLPPLIQRLALGELKSTPIPPLATLYIPPLRPEAADPGYAHGT